ncbi:MAG: GntR family transcriptional regulator [Anaerolineales bacterium]|nr:GntR family transcriptional regulator [Anaerolineales bacterium]
MVAYPTLEKEGKSTQKRPLKEDLFEVLHEKIISGEYKPGAWLRQDEIATQLGVSMTPVREGLDLLVSAGLAERVPYRGVRVREIVMKDVIEAYGLRLMLEVAIAQEAAKNITPEQAASLERMIAEMREHNSLKEMSTARKLSRDFHSAIADITQNALLIKLYGIVANAFPDWILYEALFRKPEILAASMSAMHDEHLRIVNALKARDGAKTALYSVEHVMESGKWLETYLEHPAPAELFREKEQQVLTLLEKQ